MGQLVAPCFFGNNIKPNYLKMFDFEVKKSDILLKKYYHEFENNDHSFSNFYKHAIHVNERFLCYPEDHSLFHNEECFALASLKNNCIMENWDNIIADIKDVETIDKLYGIYYKYHIKSVEGVSCNITDNFKQLRSTLIESLIN